MSTPRGFSMHPPPGPVRAVAGTIIRRLSVCAPALIAWVASMAADPIVDPLDPGDWRITNPKTPGNVTRREGRLIIRHAPGGGVTWGCAATKRFPDVNMDESPFLVVNVAEMSGDFQVKLNGSPPGWKKATVLRTDSTGLVSVDIALATGWGGKGTMSVSLYTLGDGSSLQVDLVKLTTTPSASEREVEKSFSPPPVPRPTPGSSHWPHARTTSPASATQRMASAQSTATR